MKHQITIYSPKGFKEELSISLFGYEVGIYFEYHSNPIIFKLWYFTCKN